jgi:hypothetical protein
MANYTLMPNETIYYWLNYYGFTNRLLITVICLIPISIIGFILNIIALIVLNGRDFKRLSVYYSLRVYTMNSALLCLVTSTKFISESHKLFDFSNTYSAQLYYAKFCAPISNILYFYATCLDILLTFDRIMIFSNRFQWLKRIKPKWLCLNIFIFCFIGTLNFWFTRSIAQTKVITFEVGEYIIYSKKGSNMRNRYVVFATTFLIDILPIIAEISLNLVIIFLLKRFIKQKNNIGLSGIRSLPNIIGNSINNTNLKDEMKRVKKMEIRVTILIIFMSFLSLM